MLRCFVLFGVLVIAGLAAPRLAADVEVEITFRHFHERLAPHGVWIEVEHHGWCWYPDVVDSDWRPYTHGHWVYADAHGWVWVSDYDWGWACFHYGRWHYHNKRWVWVPGYEWSGAWVVWRHGGAHVGWAPLPPSVGWEVGVGLKRGNFNFEVDIYEPSWVFVAEAQFTAPRLKSVVVSSSQTSVVIKKTTVLGSVHLEKSVAMNGALKISTIEAATGKPVKAVKVVATGSVGAAMVKGGEGEVRVFKPKVRKADVGSPKDIDRAEAARKTREERDKAEKEVGKKPAREGPDKDRKPGDDDPDKGDKPGREDPDKGKKPDKGDEPRKDDPSKGKKPGGDEPSKGKGGKGGGKGKS